MSCTARPALQVRNSGLLNPVLSLKDNTNGISSPSTAADPCSWLRYINRDRLYLFPRECFRSNLSCSVFKHCGCATLSWWGALGPVKTKSLNIWIHSCSQVLNTNRCTPCAARLSFEILKIHIFSTDKHKVMVFCVSLIKIQGFSKAPGLTLKLL